MTIDISAYLIASPAIREFAWRAKRATHKRRLRVRSLRKPRSPPSPAAIELTGSFRGAAAGRNCDRRFPGLILLHLQYESFLGHKVILENVFKNCTPGHQLQQCKARVTQGYQVLRAVYDVLARTPRMPACGGHALRRTLRFLGEGNRLW